MNKRILLPKVDTKNTIGELNDFSFDFYYSEEDKYEHYSRLTELPAVETDELAVVPDWVPSSVVITIPGSFADTFSSAFNITKYITV